jgi:glycosyltransferase involved in cell wall biosynthesis
MATVNDTRRPAVCVIATTPLSVHFFLRGHVAGLARFAEVTLATNPREDAHTPPLNLPVQRVDIGIERRIHPWKDAIAFLQIVVLLTRRRFDLVWAVGPKAGLLGMLAAFLARAPRRVFVFQGEVWATRHALGRWVLKTADRITARAATHVLSVGESERRFLAAQGVVPLRRTAVLGAGGITGVDGHRFRPDPQRRGEMRRRLGVSPDCPLALFLGRFTRDKGLLLLAEAFQRSAARRSDLHLLLVGPDEESLVPDILRRLGGAADRCRVVGFTTRPEDYLMASDFLCLPSRREGLNITVLQAAATGIPTLGARIPGIVDVVVHEETGILVDRADAASWSSGIDRLAADDAARQRLGATARAWVLDRFEQSVVENRYLDFFSRCLGGTR